MLESHTHDKHFEIIQGSHLGRLERHDALDDNDARAVQVLCLGHALCASGRLVAATYGGARKSTRGSWNQLAAHRARAHLGSFALLEIS